GRLHRSGRCVFPETHRSCAMKNFVRTFAILLVALPASGGDLSPAEVQKATSIRCGNLTYGGSKSSRCFADQFLMTAAKETGLKILSGFKEVRVDSDE